MKVIEGEKLSLSGVQRTDMGGYLCIASNGIPPSVSKRYDVQVNCKWPISLQILKLSLCLIFLKSFFDEKRIMIIKKKVKKKAQNIDAIFLRQQEQINELLNPVIDGAQQK